MFPRTPRRIPARGIINALLPPGTKGGPFMKRILAVLLVLLLIPAACAEVLQAGDNTIHGYAMGLLHRINDVNCVTQAEEIFGEISSGYGHASLYRVYCQAVIAIHTQDMENAEALISLLAYYPEFAASLEENALPSCEDLTAYVHARKAENEGRVVDAMTLYRSINLLDSVQRSVNLISSWQEEAYALAKELLAAEDYASAADLFSQLGSYSDSAALAAHARALIPAATPEPIAEITAEPSAAPEYRPLARGDRGDEVLALQNRLYELGFFKDVCDGIYGGKTAEAVRLFQYVSNLEATGNADEITLALIFADDQAAVSATSAPTPEPTPEFSAEPEPELTPEPTAEPTPEPTQTPTPQPTQTPSPADSTLGTVNRFSSSAEILDLQQLLVSLSLMLPGDADGAYNSATTYAVRTFQLWVNEKYGPSTVPISGDADALTIAYMRYSVETGVGPASPAAPQATPENMQKSSNMTETTPVTAFCYDDAAVLSDAFEQNINAAGQRLSAACGAEIVVAAIKTTGSMSIQDYGTALYNTWGIGDEAKRNGFLLLLVIDDDNYYAKTGEGLDKLFPRTKLQEYFAMYLEPDFAAKNYEEGARKIFDAVYADIAGMYGINIA